MADTVIDAGEMQYFDELRSVLKFTRQDEIDASAMTLSEAVEIMREAVPRRVASFCDAAANCR